MADSPTEKAAKAVAIACAASTTFVKIVKMSPFVVAPNDLFKKTFSSVGITSDAQLEAFRHTLIEILPNSMLGDLLAMDLGHGIEIGLVVDHIEALLDALP